MKENINISDLKPEQYPYADEQILKKQINKYEGFDTLLLLIISITLLLPVIFDYKNSGIVLAITSLINIIALIYISVARRSCKKKITNVLTKYQPEHHAVSVVGNFEVIQAITIYLLIATCFITLIVSVIKLVS